MTTWYILVGKLSRNFLVFFKDKMLDFFFFFFPQIHMLLCLPLFLYIVYSAWILTFFFLPPPRCWRKNICNKITQPKEGSHISSNGTWYPVWIRKLFEALHDKLGLLCAVFSIRCWLLLCVSRAMVSTADVANNLLLRQFCQSMI